MRGELNDQSMNHGIEGGDIRTKHKMYTVSFIHVQNVLNYKRSIQYFVLKRIVSSCFFVAGIRSQQRIICVSLWNM